MKFQPERLILLRNTLNINKAEAARRLNISPMVYGRYENGQREPSYPTVGFIAQTFNCNIDYLYGTSDKTDPDQAGQQCRMQNTYICTQAARKIKYHANQKERCI